MNIEVNLDAARAIERIGRGHKLPFVAVRALNTTGEAVQRAVRDQVVRSFVVRKPFVLSQIKLFKASFDRTTGTGRWEARVSIGGGKPPSGGPLLLPGYEAGFTREPRKGQSVAVPVVGGARPTLTQAIPDVLFIQRLQLRRASRGRPRKRNPGAPRPALRGLLGTFVTPAGIVQRVGKATTRLLYAFAQPFHVAPRLGFYVTARRVVQSTFAREVARLVNEAFARHG